MKLPNSIELIDKKDLKKWMKDPVYSIELIYLFIKENFVSTRAYEIAKRQMLKLSSFYKETEYQPSPSILEQIIKENELLRETLTLLVKINLKQIKSGNIDKLFSDDILMITVETYCALNNIEIVEEVEELIYDESAEEDLDSERMYIREINRKPLLTPEEERNLLKRVKNKDEAAKKELIERNLRLVVPIARKYKKRGVDFLDLIQFGNLGLIKAIEKFDLKKECKLSTCAIPWIRQGITRGIADTCRTMRYPVYLNDELYNYKKTKREIEFKTGREAAPSEISEEMGIKIEKVYKLEKLIQDPISLSTPIDEEEADAVLQDFIPSEDIEVEEETIAGLRTEQLVKLIESCNLKDREKVILSYRYPLDEKKKLLKELKDTFNITGERIRQLEAAGIRKIVENKKTDKFAEWMADPEAALAALEIRRAFYKEKKNRLKIYSEDKGISYKKTNN